MIHTWLNRYTFNVVQFQSPMNWNWFPEVGGLYLFVAAPIRSQFSTRYSVLYVGEASSIRTRLPSHEKIPEARNLGMTEIHYMTEADDLRRRQIEKDLIQRLQPELNVQHR